MKTSANYHRSARPTTSHSWLPAQVAAPRALNFSHWLSRAARGYTWNADATFKPTFKGRGLA